MTNKVLKLFENCFVTVGNQRSMIIDTQRNNYYFIPNSLALLFDENNVFNIGDQSFDEEAKLTIDEYVDFLLQQELCFYCSPEMIKHFPKIDTNKWDYPAKITNAVIEMGVKNFEKIILFLEELTTKFLTRHIEIYFPEKVDYRFAANTLKIIDALDLYSYSVIIGLENNSDLDSLIQLLNSHHKIERSIIYSANKTEIIEKKSGWGNIFLKESKFTFLHCGVIDRYNVSINLAHITESINYNSCLNRKIAIDIEGNIKNCPNTTEIYGNINSTSLHQVLHNTEFTKYWKVKKDDISVCKDCEFRHICTDCRAFIEIPEDIHSKPLKCGYSPYTCEWQDWATNPIKLKSIQHYGLNN